MPCAEQLLHLAACIDAPLTDNFAAAHHRNAIGQIHDRTDMGRNQSQALSDSEFIYALAGQKAVFFADARHLAPFTECVNARFGTVTGKRFGARIEQRQSIGRTIHDGRQHMKRDCFGRHH